VKLPNPQSAPFLSVIIVSYIIYVVIIDALLGVLQRYAADLSGPYLNNQESESITVHHGICVKNKTSDERVLAHLSRSGAPAGRFRRLSRIAFFPSPVGGALTKNEIRRVDILRP